jgi:hypothetical protein
MMELSHKDKLPNYGEIIGRILAEVNGPLPIEQLVAQILDLRPSQARNPRQAALAKIREEQGRQLVYWDEAHVLPLHLAYQGARYRIRLDKEMVDRAALPLAQWFDSYRAPRLGWDAVRWMDSHGHPIPAQFQEVKKLSPFFKNEEYTEAVVVLREWFRSQQVYHKDHLLVTVIDWERGVFLLERERYGNQQPELLAQRNRMVADQLFDMLEKARYEDLSFFEAISTVYARLPDKSGYPPDHWAVIVSEDPRMTTDGFNIHYSDSGFSMLERMVIEMTGESTVPPGQPYSRDEGQQVYRLHAELARRPSIWREVEVQGKQSLADLDGTLRAAFQHDFSDHLSGFWQRVAREGGYRKRYREIELGKVEPFGGGEGAGKAIAGLKLHTGDQIKYVYDFGDWVEHKLVLEAIGAPEKGAKYPREVARNKPSYKECRDCRARGKSTVATWVCIDCSENEGQEVELCEDCLSERHEEHYSEEIVY